jgi:hypothetical protein
LLQTIDVGRLLMAVEEEKERKGEERKGKEVRIVAAIRSFVAGQTAEGKK